MIINNSGIEVIVGTYENIVIGYQLRRDDNEEWKLEQSFTDLTHSGCIKAVAANDKFLVSGSTDEAIKVSNLGTRTDVGSLLLHNGSVNCLEFFNNSYLFSGSEDSDICIWKTKQWKCEKTLQGHKKAVTDIAIHPSGKIALTTSRDRTLRTWNLIKGRSAYITNLHKVGNAVKWSPSGCYYAVSSDNVVDVYKIEVAGIIHSIKTSNKVHCFIFVNDDILCVGGEDEHVYVYNLSSKEEVGKFSAHKNRIKSLIKLPPIQDLSDLNKVSIASSSSDGFIKIWSLNMLDYEAKLITEVDTTCRITCMTVSTRTSHADDNKTSTDETEKLSAKRKSIDSKNKKSESKRKKT